MTHFPIPQDALHPPVLSSDKLHGEVSAVRHDVDCCTHTRVARVLSDLAAGRTVADDEIRRHIEDLRFLLETAHDRFLASGLPREQSPDLAQANEWRRLRDEALHMLSPEFKRARRAGNTGCFFLDSADRDREAMNEGAKK